jgi:hypothetical protein
MSDIQTPSPLADYVLINKAWFEQLDRYATELSSDVENSQIFSEHEKTHIQLLNSTLYGYIKSSQTVVEQGQQLASLQNDRLTDMKQTVTEAREGIAEMQSILRGDDEQPHQLDKIMGDPMAALDNMIPPVTITDATGKEIGGEVPDVVKNALAGITTNHQIPVTQAKENTEDGTTTPDTNEHSSGDAPEAQ